MAVTVNVDLAGKPALKAAGHSPYLSSSGRD